MSQAIVTSIIAGVKTSVDPIPAETWREDPALVPSVWIQPPSTRKGPYSSIPPLRDGDLTIDIWHNSWAEVQAVVNSLAWLNGHKAANALYELDRDIRFDEPDSKHAVLRYTVSYFDPSLAA